MVALIAAILAILVSTTTLATFAYVNLPEIRKVLCCNEPIIRAQPTGSSIPQGGFEVRDVVFANFGLRPAIIDAKYMCRFRGEDGRFMTYEGGSEIVEFFTTGSTELLIYGEQARSIRFVSSGGAAIPDNATSVEQVCSPRFVDLSLVPERDGRLTFKSIEYVIRLR